MIYHEISESSVTHHHAPPSALTKTLCLLRRLFSTEVNISVGLVGGIAAKRLFSISVSGIFMLDWWYSLSLESWGRGGGGEWFSVWQGD